MKEINLSGGKETVSVAVANFTQILFHSFLAYRI
jgi:hypothetical protein